MISNDEDDDENGDGNEEAPGKDTSDDSDIEYAEASETNPEVAGNDDPESSGSFHTPEEDPEEIGKGEYDAQPVVTRKQSIQKSVGDLISLFENTAR